MTKLLRDRGPQPPTGARGAATPIFGLLFAQLCLNITKTQMLGALLTASGLLSLYTNFYPYWTTNGLVKSQKPYAHI